MHLCSLFYFHTKMNVTEICNVIMGFPVGSAVKICLSIQETRVQSLGCEDPLEEELATHSSILAWEIPMDWWATVHGVTKESDTA